MAPPEDGAYLEGGSSLRRPMLNGFPHIRPIKMFYGLAMCLAVAPAHAADTPFVKYFEGDLAVGNGPVRDMRVAAHCQTEVGVAWCVGEGLASGVYLRQRLHFQWETPLRVPGYTGQDPRDLVMAYDIKERLHLFWTAINGSYRHLFYASFAGPELITPSRVLDPGDASDADYPEIFLNGDSFLIAWQSSRGTDYTIEAARFDYESLRFDRLPVVSGASVAAMAPQIMWADPLTLSWYEVFQTATDLRISRIDPTQETWVPTGTLGIDSSLPMQDQPLFAWGHVGLPLAYWQEIGDAGYAEIKVARRTSEAEETLILESIGTREGDHRQPHLTKVSGSEFTISWQTIVGNAMSVQLARINLDTGERRDLTISQPDEHRFASDPWHFTQSSSSYVVWVDDAREGGTGQLGFADVSWSPLFQTRYAYSR